MYLQHTHSMGEQHCLGCQPADTHDPQSLHQGKKKDPLDYALDGAAKDAKKYIVKGGGVFLGRGPDW